MSALHEKILEYQKWLPKGSKEPDKNKMKRNGIAGDLFVQGNEKENTISGEGGQRKEYLCSVSARNGECEGWVWGWL